MAYNNWPVLASWPIQLLINVSKFLSLIDCSTNVNNNICLLKANQFANKFIYLFIFLNKALKVLCLIEPKFVSLLTALEKLKLSTTNGLHSCTTCIVHFVTA